MSKHTFVAENGEETITEKHSGYKHLRDSKNAYYMFYLSSKKHHKFLLVIISLLVITAVILPYPNLAKWFGFMVASYSVIANDSIQTIGIFIASNSQRKWWYLWLFIGIIFVVTIAYSWMVYKGDVSYQRLSGKGFSEAPESFRFLQLATPIILLLLTHWRIPVSTSFLLLNVFATDCGAIGSVVQKSFYGYFISFFVAIVFWYLFSKIFTKYLKKKPWKGWVVGQWIASGLLWSVWIMQDASNIAIFLPRSLNFIELLLFIGFVFLGLGVLFYRRGDKMQRFIDEKSDTKDIRAAILINLVYMLILFYFKNVNNIPMSTTWVFIGLLGGREIALSLANTNVFKRKESFKKGIGFVKRDFKNALMGLSISIILAFLVNTTIREKVMNFFIILFK